MERHLELIGAALVLLALVHLAIPRYCGWNEGLAGLSLLNRQMMKVHTFFIALAVLLMGLLCLTSAADLVQTVLGRRIALGLAIFWSFRLVVQLFGYSTELWRRKPFETSVHLLFTVLWAYIAAVFLWVATA